MHRHSLGYIGSLIGGAVKPVLGDRPLQPSKSGHTGQVVAYNGLHTKSYRHNYQCV